MSYYISIAVLSFANRSNLFITIKTITITTVFAQIYAQISYIVATFHNVPKRPADHG